MPTVLHIGLHKTGTSTLQEALADRVDWLARRGVHYPLERGSRGGAHKLACWLSTPRNNAGPNDLFFPERERFAAEINARACNADEFDGLLATSLPMRL